MDESDNNVFMVILSYFFAMFVFEWIFGKLFWDFDSLLVLLYKGKYFCAIILVLVIYFSSYILLCAYSENNKGALLGIGLILLLLAGHNVYDLSQAKTVRDVGHTFAEMICWADYPEFLQLISVFHAFVKPIK